MMLLLPEEGLVHWVFQMVLAAGCEYITVSHANEAGAAVCCAQDGFAQDNALPEIKGSCYFNH
eukprot:1190090-Amphidinium_carterae.1